MSQTVENLEFYIKKYLLPYNSFLKISQIGETIDETVHIIPTPPVSSFSWIEGNFTCTDDGIKTVINLIQIDNLTGFPTGEIKLNVISNDDYIAPYFNTHSCPLKFWNTELNFTFQRNNCGEGYEGSDVDLTIAAHTTFSNISVEYTNQIITDSINSGIGQTYANENGTCTLIPEPTIYYNTLQEDSFMKDDCEDGSSPEEPTIYTVAANTYSSLISVEDANQQALDDINANGQNYANENGFCIVVEDHSIITITNKFSKPLRVTTPSSLIYNININNSLNFTQAGVYQFLVNIGIEGETEPYWKFNPSTYDDTDPSTYETGFIVSSIPINIALANGDTLIFTGVQPPSSSL